jgi:hypothetical protein
MTKIRSRLRTFASSGLGAAYSDQYTTQAVYGSLEYLSQNFQWPRTAYMSKYEKAFGQQDINCFYKLQYSCKKIELAFSQLQQYAQAKANSSSSEVIKAAMDSFLKVCSNKDCDDAVRFVMSAMNGGDLNSNFDDNIGCDMAELLQRGAPA